MSFVLLPVLPVDRRLPAVSDIWTTCPSDPKKIKYSIFIEFYSLLRRWAAVPSHSCSPLVHHDQQR